MSDAIELAQAFEIPAATIGLKGVPQKVMQAALGGKHAPVIPHCQRLLVAAAKQPEIPKEAEDPTNEKEAKPKPVAKSKASAKPKAGAANAKSKGTRPPYADTEYNIQRKAFFATFLI